MADEPSLSDLSRVWSGRWNEQRAQRARAGAVQRARGKHAARARRVALASATVAVAGLLAGVLGWSSTRQREPEPATLHAAGPRVLGFRDGSRATLHDARAVLQVRDSGHELVAELARGGATFEVRHDPSRTFLVQAGVVSVSVVGTAFSVVREGIGARVAVQTGSVRVAWAAEELELLAGMSGVFPPPGKSLTPVPSPASAPAPAPAVSAQVAAPQQPVSAPGEWRELARDGSYPTAYRSLANAGASSVRDEPGDILLAADVARLSGHPAEAARWLRRLLDRHTRDGRAPAAAFTLGRVLTDELGDAAGGAQAFARAEQLAPSGTLAESALSRSAEAWLKAGNRSQARAAASRYLTRYPSGRHAARMQQLNGLE